MYTASLGYVCKSTYCIPTGLQGPRSRSEGRFRSSSLRRRKRTPHCCWSCRKGRFRCLTDSKSKSPSLCWRNTMRRRLPRFQIRRSGIVAATLRRRKKNGLPKTVGDTTFPSYSTCIRVFFSPLRLIAQNFSARDNESWWIMVGQRSRWSRVLQRRWGTAWYYTACCIGFGF